MMCGIYNYTVVFLIIGTHRSFANKDFHDGTQSGKVGPVWNTVGGDKPLVEV